MPLPFYWAWGLNYGQPNYYERTNNPVINDRNADMDLILNSLALKTDVLDRIGKEVYDSPDDKLGITVKQRVLVIIGQSELDLRSARIILDIAVCLGDNIPDVEDLHPACVRALRKNEEVINDILHPYSIIFDPSAPGKEFLPCRTAFLACSLDREY